MNVDWKKMCENVIKTAAPNAKNNEVLYGKNKIFQSNAFVLFLDEKLEVKQKVKRQAIQKISNSFKQYEIMRNWDAFRTRQIKVITMAKNLLATWNSKIEYAKFKSVINIVKKMQRNHRMLEYKRVLRLQKFQTAVIGRSFKLFQIRRTLFNANRIANSLNKCARKVMFRAFQVRLKFNKQLTENIFNKSWRVIEIKMETEASNTIERIFRGYASRLQSVEEVNRLAVIKSEVKKNNAATAIQKMSKGFLVRARMDRLHRAAGFIQGYTRMLWLSKYYKMMRTSVRKIQTVVRKYLIRNQKIQERMSLFMTNSKQYIRQLRTVEHDVIFKQKEAFFNVESLENYTKVKFFEDEISFKDSIPHVESFIPDPPSIDLNPKMRMFSVLIDFDCHVDTSDIYERSWAIDFLTFLEGLNKRNTRLLHLEVGESFTLAVDDDLRLYSWGLNDYCQLGRKIDSTTTHHEPKLCKPLNGIQPRIISSGDEHTIMVDYTNDVYVWGGNMSGQLGIGHSRETRNIVKLNSVGKNIKYVASKGKKSYLITNEGTLYMWPNKSTAYKFVPCPASISDPDAKFVQISCGHNFAVALTQNGLLYSYGQNTNGELGLGHLHPRETFTLIDHLKQYGEKISEIS